MVMEAQLFDGTILEFPDGTDPAVIQQTAKKVTASLNAGEAQPQEQQQRTTSNPILGFGGRAAELFGNVLEGGSRLVEKPIAQLPEQYRPELGTINEMSQYAKDISKRINYAPSTKLGELADNPLNAVPFIAERVLTSSPDMMAAYAAAPAYIMGRTNEILNTRLKNDSKEYKDATITDLSASVSAAVLEAYLEKFATKGLLTGKGPLGGSVAKRIGKETAIQSGTEGVEEGIGYLGGAAGTKKGIDPAEMAQGMIEGAIVGGGLGAGVQGGKEYFNRPSATPPQEPPAVAPSQPAVSPTPSGGVTPVPTGTTAQDYEAMMAEVEGRPFTPTAPEAVAPKPMPEEAVAPEINQAALEQNNFVFPEKGGIKSVYGNIVEQDGKKFIEYNNDAGQKRRRLLTERVMVNPSPDDLDLMNLYKERDKLATQSDQFLKFLKQYKIKPSEKADMGIDPSDRRIPVGVFNSQKGKTLDDLALIALEDGVLTEQDLQDGVGGVESLRELIRQTLTGQQPNTMVNADRDFALQRIQDEIDNREANRAPPEEAVADQFLEQETEAESRARIAQQEANLTEQQRAQMEADRLAKVEQDRAEVQRLSQAAAGDFQLGQTAEENLSGQQRLDDDIPFFSMDRANAKPYTKQVVNDERVLNEKIDELKRINIRRSAINRRFATDKLKPLDQREANSLMERAKELEDDIDNLKWATRNLTAEKFMARAADSLAKDEISQEVFDVIYNIYQKNPNLLEGLRLQIKKGNENEGNTNFQTAGEFIGRIVRLYKDTSGIENPAVIRHELTHSLEQVMTKDVKKKLVQEWRNKLDRAQRLEKTKEGKAFFDALSEHLKAPTRESFVSASNAMPNTSYYQYMSPSEYWAVNAEKLMEAQLGGAWKKFQKFVRGLFESLKNVFGLDNKSTIHNVFNEVINGKRLSTTMLTDMQGSAVPTLATEPKAPGRRNYKGDQAPLSNWNMPDNTKMDNFLYRIQDKYIDTKRMIKAINDQVGEIADKWDTYLKEELYHGRTAKRANDFLKDDLLPIVKQMQKDNISVEQFDDYLHNRHAEERNIQVAKINPDMQDAGSGIKTADADAYLDGLAPERRAQLEGLAKKVDSIIKDTQKILVDSGLETQETIDAWNKTYKNYVPLMREDLDFSNKTTGLGSGFSTKGGSTKRAVGSLKNVSDIFANVAGQRERAIVRSEKARVGTSLYGLAIQNPNPGFWLPVNPDAIKNPEAMKKELAAMGVDPADAENLMQEPKQQYIDPVTGLVAYRVNPILRNSDNVFPVRINGKDRFIFFNPNDERSMRMAEAIKNLDAEQLGWALGMAAKATRWLASVNTQYNPVFGAYNFIRDVGGAQFNLSTTPIAGEQAAVTAGVFPALKGIYKDLRASRDGKPIDGSEWSKLFEEYQREGGATGYRDQFSRNRDESSVIEREMANLNKGNVKKAVNAVFNWLSDYNDAMENAVRLSAYKVALDKGITKERAASIAKNLTVNFNRKGERAQQVGALYAFFNASVQGTSRLAETLKGPAGKKIIGGGLLLGSVQALALALAGFEDDDIPEFVKERNLIIPLPGKNYGAIPMPLGLHVIPNMGRIPTEMILTGGKDASKKVGNMLGVILNSFNPIGSAGLSTQTIAPTLVDPIVAIFENRDNFGRPIAKEDRATNPTPGYTRSRDTASELSKGLSYFLNYATSGGSKYQKGWMSPTPDQLDFLFGQATGGVGREIMKTEQAVTSLVTGEELPAYKIPLIGKFGGNTESQAAQANRFYENVTAMANHENEIKGRQKNRESVTDYYNDHPEARLYSQANTIENEITKLNKQKKEMIARNAPKEQIKRLEEQKTLIMQRFNERVRKLENQ
jgi:hypothetical protein